MDRIFSENKAKLWIVSIIITTEVIPFKAKYQKPNQAEKGRVSNNSYKPFHFFKCLYLVTNLTFRPGKSVVSIIFATLCVLNKMIQCDNENVYYTKTNGYIFEENT